MCVTLPSSRRWNFRRVSGFENVFKNVPGGIVNRGFVILVLCECIAGAVTLGYVFERRLATGDEYDRQVELAVGEAKRVREQTILAHNERVSAGENFKVALERFGLSAEEAASASAAAQRAFNLRQLR